VFYSARGGAGRGDALGAGYEFGPSLPPEVVVTMRGGKGLRRSGGS
jgi:hypothetical protein